MVARCERREAGRKWTDSQEYDQRATAARRARAAAARGAGWGVVHVYRSLSCRGREAAECWSRMAAARRIGGAAAFGLPEGRDGVLGGWAVPSLSRARGFRAGGGARGKKLQTRWRCQASRLAVNLDRGAACAARGAAADPRGPAARAGRRRARVRSRMHAGPAPPACSLRHCEYEAVYSTPRSKLTWPKTTPRPW